MTLDELCQSALEVSILKRPPATMITCVLHNSFPHAACSTKRLNVVVSLSGHVHLRKDAILHGFCDPSGIVHIGVATAIGGVEGKQGGRGGGALSPQISTVPPQVVVL